MDNYKIIWDKLKNSIDTRIKNISEHPTDVDINLAKRVKELVEENQLVKIQKLMKVLEEELQENK